MSSHSEQRSRLPSYSSRCMAESSPNRSTFRLRYNQRKGSRVLCSLPKRRYHWRSRVGRSDRARHSHSSPSQVYVDAVPALYAAAMDGATDASAHVTEFPLLDEMVIMLS